MKKLLTALLCAISFSAFAVDYGIGVQYDYDNFNSNSSNVDSVKKVGVLVGARTSFGQFDAGVYNAEVKGQGFSDNNLGVEAGYGLRYAFSNKISLSGRVAYGRLFNRGLRAPDSTGDYQTAAIGVGYPINEQLSLGVGYRRRFGDLGLQNQYSVGGTYQFNRNYQLRMNVVHNTYADGRQTNGLGTMLLYIF